MILDDTYLIERDADEEDAEKCVEVILERPFPDLQERKLDEVDKAPERYLEEVQNEDGDAPLLVRIVQVHVIILVNGGNTQSEAGDDQRKG